MNKKLLLLLLYISLIFLVLERQQDVWAEDNIDYIVVTENKETRLHAGANDLYKVSSVIPENYKLLVISEFVNGENEKWLQVKYNNRMGWIENTNLKTVEIKGQFFTPSSSEAPIRKGAAITYKQAGSLQRGQMVKGLEGFTNSDGEKWIRIENGKVTGWTPLASIELFDGGKNYLNKNAYIIEETDVKRAASSAAKTSYTIKKGTIIIVQSSIVINNETWYKIKDGKGNGWIPASHTTNQLNQSLHYFVKNQSAEVRQGALSSYKVISTLTVGQKVKSTAAFINGKNEIWYRSRMGKWKKWLDFRNLTLNKENKNGLHYH